MSRHAAVDVDERARLALNRRRLGHFVRLLDPAAVQVLATIVAYADVDQFEALIEALGDHWAQLGPSLGKARQASLTAARREERGRTCKVCGRVTAGTDADRLRDDLCPPCYRSWRRASAAGASYDGWLTGRIARQRNHRHRQGR